jgi:carboxyl-terminal processing protease
MLSLIPKKHIVSVLTGALLSVCVVGTVGNAQTDAQLALFNEVMEMIEQDYVEPVDSQQLFYNSLRGMVSSLDAYSDFYDPEEYKRSQETVTGQFAGIGVVIEPKGQQIVIVSTLDDSPARRVGIKAGDILLSVNGQPAIAPHFDDISNDMLGEIGTSILLTVVNSLGETTDYTLERQAVELDTHEIRNYNGVFYIRVGAFNQSTASRLIEEILQSEQIGARAYILDLRNNPGGLLTQAVQMADLFLESGPIVTTQSRNNFTEESVSAEVGDAINGKPLIVMVNKGSASAAEIVAASLQDNHRAMIVGQKTFGKASIQAMTQLRDGSGIKMTVGQYVRPSGQSINHIGVTPDVSLDIVNLDADKLLESIETASEMADVDVEKLTTVEQENFYQKQKKLLLKTDPNLHEALQLMQVLVFAKTE